MLVRTRQPQLALTLALVSACCLAPTVSQAQTTAAPPAVASSATAAAVPATKITTVEGITEYRLPNGMQVLLVPDDSKPTTTVNVTYRVGSKHENYGETGMAHLLEHLIFKGTPTTKNVWGEFTKRGLRANGTTWTDRTNYFASFATNEDNLKWYLSWQADAMVNSFIAKADLDSEMTVVRNEMEMGENSPIQVLWTQAMAAMYTWHNYGKSTIGARSDVENVDIGRLQAFYRQYYQPDNATLTVAGKFDPASTLRYIEQSFGAIKKPNRILQRQYTIDPVQDGERAVTVRRVGGTPMLMVGWHVPAGSHPDFAAASLLSGIFGTEGTGRLHRRLVEPKIAASAFGEILAFAEPSPFFLGAQLAPGQDPERAKTALLAAVDAVAKEPITQVELDRAKTRWLNQWERGFTDPERIGVELSESLALGDWRLYFVQRDQVRNLRLADVQRVATERLRRDNRTVGMYLPTAAPERAPAPAFADVPKLVGDYKGDATAALAEAFDASPGNIDKRTETRKLASGLQVALLPKATRGRLVQARLKLNHGDEASLQKQAIVGLLAGATLDHGGGSLSRQQLKDTFDKLRADVAFSIGAQALTVDITTTRDNLAETVATVVKVLRQPTLSQASLDEVRSQWLANIEAQRKEPDAVISNWLNRHANEHPRGHYRYASTFEEMIDDIKGIKAPQLQAYMKRFISAAHGEFSAVGDIDVAALNKTLDSTLGVWSAPTTSKQAYTRLPNPLTALKPERHVAITPDKQNANLRAALPLAVDDKSPDHAALVMANYLFGRGGSSRLWQRVREKDGLSYDVRSGVEWSSFEPNSRFVMSAIFAPQNQSKVETAIQEELARALKDGFTAAELDEGRRGLLSLRALGRAQDLQLAGQLTNNLHLGRRFAFDQSIDEQIGKLSLEQVNAVFRKYIDPSKIVYAWGGDFKQP
jgi:zinc protease